MADLSTQTAYMMLSFLTSLLGVKSSARLRPPGPSFALPLFSLCLIKSPPVDTLPFETLIPVISGQNVIEKEGAEEHWSLGGRLGYLKQSKSFQVFIYFICLSV